MGILSRAVFSKCLAEILTSSSKWSQWDVTGLPVLSASNVTLGEWLERAQQLWEVSAVMWTNLAFSSMAEFRYWHTAIAFIPLSSEARKIRWPAFSNQF